MNNPAPKRDYDTPNRVAAIVLVAVVVLVLAALVRLILDHWTYLLLLGVIVAVALYVTSELKKDR